MVLVMGNPAMDSPNDSAGSETIGEMGRSIVGPKKPK